MRRMPLRTRSWLISAAMPAQRRSGRGGAADLVVGSAGADVPAGVPVGEAGDVRHEAVLAAGDAGAVLVGGTCVELRHAAAASGLREWVAPRDLAAVRAVGRLEHGRPADRGDEWHVGREVDGRLVVLTAVVRAGITGGDEVRHLL